MPIYSYLCAKCNIEEELILSINHRQQSCSSCRSKMKRQLSAPALLLQKGFSDDSKTQNAAKHSKRVRQHFVSHGREEAIARGGTEWKYGTTTQEIAKNTLHKNATPTASERG